MSSESRPRPWRTALAAAWIFGTAAYFYIHFALVFLQENEAAIRARFPELADALLSRPRTR